MHTHPHTDGHTESGGGGHRSSEISHEPRKAEARGKDRGRLYATLALSIVVMSAEAVGGYYTHSLALLSDAGHMFTDASVIVLSLLALWFGARPANQSKTYGYHRLEILAALVNGLALIGISLGIAYEGYLRLSHPVEVDVAPMLAVAVAGLIANGFGIFMLEGSHNLNTRGVLLHLIGDLLASAGVAIAAIIMWRTHWWIADPVVSMVVSLIILGGAFNLVREAVDVLLEATPRHLDGKAIVEAMEHVPSVVTVHDLHVWTIATGMYALSAHLVVSRAKCAESDDILRAVKDVLAEKFHIDHTTLQIESESYAHVGEDHDHAHGEEHDHEHDHAHVHA